MVGTEVDLSPGYQSNHVALVNRMHRTIREMLLKSTKDFPEWEYLLPYVIQAYNASPHPSHRLAPKEVLLGIRPRVQIDRLIGARIKPTAADKTELLQRIELARQKIYDVVRTSHNDSLSRARERFESSKKYKTQKWTKRTNRLSTRS